MEDNQSKDKEIIKKIKKNNFSRYLAVFIIAILIIGIAYYLGRLYQSPYYPLVIKNGEISWGATEILAKSGQVITLTITSDTPGTFLVQGYLKQYQISKNQPTNITFTANLPGHFSYGFTNSNSNFGSLNVSP